MDFASMTPLEGGWAGRTFLAEAGGQRQVVRLHLPHETEQAEATAALLRLVRGLLPVAEVVELRRGDVDADVPALLITSFVPGVRGDLLLPGLDDAGLATLGGHVGTLVATLGGMPMPRFGLLVGADLILTAYDGPDLLDAAASPTGREHWSDDERAGLVEVAGEAQALLDTVERTCLVHSDLNPKNLLVDPGTLAVTGLVDWEFAHAGHPFTDLGNVLRFDRHPSYVAAVLDRYVDLRGGSVDTALDLARSADLPALLDLAGRRGQNPVADHAHDRLRAIARTRDRHASS